MDEAQTGIKFSERNINKHTYADDTTLMTESADKLKSLFMKVKEESEKKTGIKLNIQKKKFMASCPLTMWQIDCEITETMPDFIFLGSNITADDD